MGNWINKKLELVIFSSKYLDNQEYSPLSFYIRQLYSKKIGKALLVTTNVEVTDDFK